MCAAVFVRVSEEQRRVLQAPALHLSSARGECLTLMMSLITCARIDRCRNDALVPQDGSANSSPLFSSAENSFDQPKLVVRAGYRGHMTS